MRILRVCHKGETYYGEWREGRVHRIDGSPYETLRFTGQSVELGEAELLAPVEPSKIVAIGKNYRAHAEEMQEGIPPEPLMFLKPSTAVLSPGGVIRLPALSQRVDYEGELGVVIKKRCRNVPESAFAEVVFGYTCLNDVTARDLQKRDGQWTRGKSFDTFCPIGPWVETCLNPDDLAIRTLVNGEVRQSSNTGRMIHPVGKLVAAITAVMTLLPGDVIATGTPEGIGTLHEGDRVAVEIQGVGRLENRVEQEG